MKTRVTIGPVEKQGNRWLSTLTYHRNPNLLARVFLRAKLTQEDYAVATIAGSTFIWHYVESGQMVSPGLRVGLEQRVERTVVLRELSELEEGRA